MVFAICVGCAKPVQWTFENIYYGANEEQTFNIILPQKENNGHVIVYLHGGFYYTGNKLWHPLFLTEFTENNIFVTMDYRLINQNDNNINMSDIISDVDNVLMKIIDISNENGITVKDFILVGHSAGAHIGLLYGYKYFQENDNRRIKISACVSLAGPSDYTDDFGWSSMAYYGGTVEKRLSALSWIGSGLTGREIKLIQYDWANQDNWFEYIDYVNEISPINYAYKNKQIPPTLLVHGLNDTIVPYSNSIKLNNVLNSISVPHKLITVTGSGDNHMLGGKSNRTDSIKPIRYKNQLWIDELKEWMKEYLE
jgi:acetyl esterase/lipase